MPVKFSVRALVSSHYSHVQLQSVYTIGTMASSTDPEVQSSPGSQSAPNVALVIWKDKVRGRGKIWDEKETQVLIEAQQNAKSGSENLSDYHVSLYDDEENDVEFMSKEPQSASNISNARRMARKAKETFIKGKAPNKKRTSGNNLGTTAQVWKELIESFRTLVEGSMTDDNTRQRAASKKLKE
ncbi:hypothetical protein Tco_0945437, partial [Tanacetum coccineum]